MKASDMHFQNDIGLMQWYHISDDWWLGSKILHIHVSVIWHTIYTQPDETNYRHVYWLWYLSISITQHAPLYHMRPRKLSSVCVFNPWGSCVDSVAIYRRRLNHNRVENKVLPRQFSVTRLWDRLTQVIFKGLRPVLEGFVVTMHEGACETGSQIPRALARGIWRTVRTSPSALWQQTPTDRS